MKTSKLILSAGIIGTLTLAALTGTAFAWHPKGVITKKVQNVTTSSALSEADTAFTAVAAKPGDTLKYVIEVRNDGTAHNEGHNDMAKTVMTDTLPAGVELVSNPAQRQITENIGLLKPGQKITKEYAVKVTATKDGTVLNTACFTGDSTVNDSPQSGCNPAVIKVTVPVVPTPPVIPETPKTPETPVTPVTPTPVELPHTGPVENILASMLAIGISYYAVHRYLQSKRALTAALNAQR
jgi:uncharacterized repeat protein (TIGR01451 family)